MAILGPIGDLQLPFSNWFSCPMSYQGIKSGFRYLPWRPKGTAVPGYIGSPAKSSG